MEKETVFALVAAFPIALFVASTTSGTGNLTPEKITDNPGKYSGENTTLEATVRQGPTACTQIACSAENRCCNTCSGTVEIGEGKKITLTGGEVGCSGNNCEVNCTPETGEEYLITGVLENNSGRLSLNVSDFEKVRN